MIRKRHTEAQSIAVVKDAQAGIGVPELCRKPGISDATFYKWRAKYAGLEVSDVKKLRQPVKYISDVPLDIHNDTDFDDLLRGNSEKGTGPA